MGVMSPFFLRFGCHSKETGDERHLTCDVSFVHSLHLSFPDHVHYLTSLHCSPSHLERTETHSRFHQLFHRTVVLFDRIVERSSLLHLEIYAIALEKFGVF